MHIKDHKKREKDHKKEGRDSTELHICLTEDVEQEIHLNLASALFQALSNINSIDSTKNGGGL